MTSDYQIKHSGIMFKADMMLAYIAGNKRMTRRTRGLDLINQDPDAWHLLFSPRGSGIRFVSFINKLDTNIVKHITMPYGGMGDQLYFKETWKMWERNEDGMDFLHYRADDAKVQPTWWSEEEWTRPDPVWAGKFKKWQSSMFMPRICSRFQHIPITNVRVERLQDITERDAYDEGWDIKKFDPYVTFVPGGTVARDWFKDLWDEINGKTLPWEKNPWVWVYEFPGR